jgi:Ca2+-binding RTX toxin-like protein
MVRNAGKRRLGFVVIGRLAPWLLTVAFGWHVAGASSAAAAVVSVSGNELTFSAAPGETNDMALALRSDGGPVDVFIAVVDTSAALTVGTGCTLIEVHVANCGTFASATVSLGDMDDSARMGTARTEQDPSVQVRLDGGDGDDYLLGGPLNDQVNGGPGNDSMDGWEGADTITGGPGADGFIMAECSGSPCLPVTSADTVVGGDGIDVAEYVRDSGVTVTLDGLANDGAPGEQDNVAADVENLAGGRGQDVLTGSAGPNEISGGAGDGGGTGDTVNGLGGDDILRANNPARNTLNGGDGNDYLYSARYLNGGDGNDRMERDSGGAPVASTISGGSGVDTASYAAWWVYDSLTITLDGVANDGTIGLQDNVGADVENLIGGSGDDTLVGSGADNRLDGGPGSDTISGAAGLDTVDYAGSTVGVNVSLDGVPNDGPDNNIHADVENVLGSDHDDRLTGSAADNRLDGGAGNDALSGGSGSDWLVGGPGADELSGASEADHLTGGDDEDTADYAERPSGVTVTLDGLPGSGNLADGPPGIRDTVDSDVENIRGGAGDDVLTGNAQANLLDGGLGDDDLHGLGGVDTVDYSARSVELFVDLGGPATSGAADESDDVSADIENVIGGSANDVLVGSSVANLVQGRAGDDVLDGAAGPDTLRGGDGVDWASYEGRAASVFADLDGALSDDGEAGEGDTLVSDVEAVEGGAGNDVLTGGASDNVLDGAAGADQLSGGGGADAVDYSDRTAVVTADADGVAGDDGSPGEGDTIAADVEDLYGGSGDDTLSGNAAPNLLFGGAGADRLDGGPGEDALFGEDGGDELTTRDVDLDLASCGAGDDLVRPDELDEVLDCERNDLTPPAPSPLAPPPPLALKTPRDTVAPTVRASVLKQRLSRVRRSGLRIRLSCSEPCTFAGRLEVDGPTARRLALKRRLLGEVRGRIVRGVKTIVLRLNGATRKALSRRRSLHARLLITARDAAGNKRTRRVSVRLR